MFAELDTVRRIEAAEASLTVELARALGRDDGVVRRLGIGLGAWTPGGSPFDKVIGWGFGVPAEDETALRAFEADVLGRGGTVRVELATVGALAHAEALSRRGYRVAGLENVLGLPLGAAYPFNSTTSWTRPSTKRKPHRVPSIQTNPGCFTMSPQ